MTDYALLGRRLRQRREELGLTMAELSAQVGVAASTIMRYEKGQFGRIKLPIIESFAAALRIDPGWLIGASDEKKETEGQKSAPSLSDEALDVAAKYDLASPTIKNVVKAVLSVDASEQAIPAVVPKLAEILPIPETPKRKIPIFNTAAGSGDPAPDIAWDYYETDNTRADFAIHVVGDSMEPLLPDGSVALGVRRMPRDGEVGAFRLDGQFLVKQVCQDIRGTTYLFSVNRDRADADQMIEEDAGRDLWCFGTILCDRVPLPDYFGRK